MKFSYLFAFLLCLNYGLAQDSPEPFLPEIAGQFPNVRDIAIAPNGNEILFTAQSVMGNLSAIISLKKINGVWQEPQVAGFSGQHFDLEPCFSTDGLKLYFASSRPLNNELKPKDFDIWYVERKNVNEPWSKPKNLGEPVNSINDEFYPSIANNGNLYFTRADNLKNTKDDIYVSIFKNGTYLEPETLPNTVNSDGYEYNAFIAPDESYIIFGAYNRPDGLGSGDLYISKKLKTGWSSAENLGPFVNSEKMDYCPFVKNDTLYFTSKRDNTIVEQEKPLSINSLLVEFNKTANGSSKLFAVPFKIFNQKVD
ncbi:TolB family protein [Bizionia sp.]|uniref:TolB family protein n=1 Tax=Bizionia sp. TaxID=1954480 RepID=UPI003A922CC1